MNNRHRIIVLSLLVAILGVAAGCSAIQDEENTESRILLVNQDNVDHAVVVEMSNETGLVYSDGRTIDSESDLDMDPFEGTGEYEVTVTVDGTSYERTHTFESDERVTNIGIDNEGSVSME